MIVLTRYEVCVQVFEMIYIREISGKGRSSKVTWLYASRERFFSVSNFRQKVDVGLKGT